MTLTEKTIESSDLVAVGCNLLAIDRFERLPLFQVDSPSELVFQRRLAVLEYIQGSTVLEEEHFLGAGRCRVTSERWGYDGAQHGGGDNSGNPGFHLYTPFNQT